PTVTFKTLGGPEWGECGQFDWKIKWFLTPAPLASEAWIVQHVVAKYDITDCDGTKENLTNWDYYEAWRIGKDGEAMPKYTYDFKGDGKPSTVDYSKNAPTDDEFYKIRHGDTKGSWTIDADAAYQATIKDGEFVPNSVFPAGGLPATKTKPTNFGTTS